MTGMISKQAAIEAIHGTRPIMAVDGTTAYRPDEVAEALRALPATSDGWQDIESAPRDQEILVTDGETVCSANGHHYSTGGNYIWEGSDDRGGLKELEITPTHWMPLPAPPEIE